jgi:Transmembrane Fragile-X-F protein
VSNGRYYLKTGAGLFVGLVTVVVITLRISGSIHWSWILILAPIWIIACVLILIIILASITIAKNAEISPDPNRVPAIPVDE